MAIIQGSPQCSGDGAHGAFTQIDAAYRVGSVMETLTSRTAHRAAAFTLALLLSTGTALSQSLKEQIVGTWRVVSIYNEQNGAKSHFYGEKPVGLLMFDRLGNVIQYLSKPDVPKFAVANRLKGTDQEYRTVMQSALAQFGTYTVEGDEVVISWTASTYPNRVGAVERRLYKVGGDELNSENRTAASGGTSYARWTRAK